jgi:hypothetical protein
LLARGAHPQEPTCTVEPDGGFDCELNGGVTGFDISPGSKRVREQILALVEERHAQRTDGAEELTIVSAQASRSRIGSASGPPDAGLASYGPLDLYFGGFGVFEDQNTTDRQIGFQSSRYGGFVGADWKLWRTIFGISVDFSHEDIDFDNKAGHADQPEVGISLYGATDFLDRLYAFAAGRVGLFDYDTKRNLNVRSIDDQVSRMSTKGDTDGYNLGIGGGLGYNLLASNNAVLNVSGSLSYFYENAGGYKEDESVSGQFDYDSFSYDSLVSNIGMAVGLPLRLDAITIVPTFSAAWAHEFFTDTETRTVNVRFDSELFEDSLLEYPINKPDEDHAELGAGLALDIGESGWSALISYSTLVAYSDLDRHAVTGIIRRTF